MTTQINGPAQYRRTHTEICHPRQASDHLCIEAYDPLTLSKRDVSRCAVEVVQTVTQLLRSADERADICEAEPVGPGLDDSLKTRNIVEVEVGLGHALLLESRIAVGDRLRPPYAHSLERPRQ